MIYFDHNATTPLLPEARAAWLDATDNYIGNPSSPHRLGARADAALDAARQTLADFLGCNPMDVVWTSGATESNNLVLHQCSRAMPPEKEVWISAIEHPCVLEATRHYFARRHRLIPATHEGTVDVDWIHKQLRKQRPALIGVMAANNETGVLQPWRELLSFCQAREIPFFCDAAQWLGKLPAAGLGDCDFVSGCAHKFGGPKGAGFLKCPARGRFYPLLLGGKQEDGRRAGTENVPGILALVAALNVRERAMISDQPKSGRLSKQEVRACSGIATRLSLRSQFERELRRALPGVEIVGASRERLWNTVCAVMPQTDCRRRWVVKLDKLGFAVSTGSACASGSEAPSHVLSAMGYLPEEASRALRFSSGWESSESDWSALLNALGRVYKGEG